MEKVVKKQESEADSPGVVNPAAHTIQKDGAQQQIILLQPAASKPSAGTQIGLTHILPQPAARIVKYVPQSNEKRMPIPPPYQSQTNNSKRVIIIQPKQPVRGQTNFQNQITRTRSPGACTIKRSEVRVIKGSPPSTTRARNVNPVQLPQSQLRDVLVDDLNTSQATNQSKLTFQKPLDTGESEMYVEQEDALLQSPDIFEFEDVSPQQQTPAKSVLPRHLDDHSYVITEHKAQGNSDGVLYEEQNAPSTEDDPHVIESLPYSCPLCFEGFSADSILQAHILVHVEQKGANQIDQTQSSEMEIEDSTNNLEELPLVAMNPGGQSSSSNVSEITPDPPSDTESEHREMSINKVWPTNKLNKPRRIIHQCMTCRKTFLRAETLTFHLKTHSNESLKCYICDKEFSFIGTLRTHVRRHTGHKAHKCRICGQRFKYRGTLEAHAAGHELLREFEQELQGEDDYDQWGRRSQPRKEPYKKNVKQTGTGRGFPIREGPFTCPVCDKEYVRLSDIKRHMNKHHSVDDYTPDMYEGLECPECKQTYTSRKALENHMVSHTGKFPYLCRFCGKGFAYKPSLQTHLMTHTQQYPHHCELCGRGCATASMKRRHQRTHRNTIVAAIPQNEINEIESELSAEVENEENPKAVGDPDSTRSTAETTAKSTDKKVTKATAISSDQEVLLSCPLCNQVFKRQSEIKRHMHTKHTAEEYKEDLPECFTCSECKQTYKSASSLRVHMISHTGDYPYKCVYCDKGFPVRRAKEMHENTHTGQYPFHCETCGKGVQKLSALRSHENTHLKYPCTICSETFHYIKILKEHMKTNHVCSVCKLTFKDVTDLKKHIEIAHDQPFQCDICEKKFGRNNTLKRHMLTVHNIRVVNAIKEDAGDSIENMQFVTEEYTANPEPELKNHIEIADNNTFQCDICKKKFGRNNSLKRHMLTVHKIKIINVRNEYAGDLTGNVQFVTEENTADSEPDSPALTMTDSGAQTQINLGTPVVLDNFDEEQIPSETGATNTPVVIHNVNGDETQIDLSALGTTGAPVVIENINGEQTQLDLSALGSQLGETQYIILQIGDESVLLPNTSQL